MSDPKYRWLVAGNVVAAGPKGQVGQRGLNTLISTVEPSFTRENLAQAQDALMRRFINETPQDKAGKIADVFVISVSNLGLMTQEQFDGSLSAAPPAVGNQ